MNTDSKTVANLNVAIACGGTGGHLFPGLAVADKLASRGCRVMLMVSPKEVDQKSVRQADPFEVVTLPAVGLRRGRELAFVRGALKSFRAARKAFRSRRPHAALAMGGFTSAPPVLAAKACGAKTFLHESNTIPGRANRWLSWVVDFGYVGFPSAAAQLKRCAVTVSGTPVRRQFESRDAANSRRELGLDPERPVILIMGGSQGATGINELVLKALPLWASQNPEAQWFHLAGSKDAQRVEETYRRLRLDAVVASFFDRMELVLAAAAAAVTRAGASTLAELAAMRVPALLIPYPAATDDHQWHNARAYAETGAATLLLEREISSENLCRELQQLLANGTSRERMQTSLARWHRPCAADEIAQHIIDLVAAPEVRKQAELRLKVPASGDPVLGKTSQKEPVTV